MEGRKTLTDPRVGLWSALAGAGLAGLWLLIQMPFGNVIFSRISYAAYAADLVAILVLLSGVAVGLLFWRYVRVKSDLLADRRVVARWRVDPDVFRTFAVLAASRDEADKRGALTVVIGFIVVIFGAFALLDPDVAIPMLAVAFVVVALVTAAFLWGKHVRRVQLTPRSAEVIVGRDGLLVNGVLHVWRTPLSRLTGMMLEPGILTVMYGYVSRMGWQTVAVSLPVPPDADAAARHVMEALGARASTS